MPRLEPTIENEHAIALTQPRQQPPGARGKSTRAIVIQHDGAVGIDTPVLQVFDQYAGVRQGVAPGDTLDHLAAEVMLKVGEMGPLDMPQGIAALAVVLVFQGKTTIQNDQPRFLAAIKELLGFHQLRNGHGSLPW
ncbi:hypothetical protein D9M73_185280 [compost metagenome]